MENEKLPPVVMTYRVITSAPDDRMKVTEDVFTQMIPVGSRGTYGLSMDYVPFRLLAHEVAFEMPDYGAMIRRAKEEGRAEILNELQEQAGERTITDYLESLYSDEGEDEL